MRRIVVALGMASLVPTTVLWVVFSTPAITLQFLGSTNEPNEVWFLSGAMALCVLGFVGVIALWYWLYLCWFGSPKSVAVRSWQVCAVLSAYPAAICLAVQGLVADIWLFPAAVVAPLVIGALMLRYRAMSPNNSFKPNPLRGFKAPCGFSGGSA